MANFSLKFETPSTIRVFPVRNSKRIFLWPEIMMSVVASRHALPSSVGSSALLALLTAALLTAASTMYEMQVKTAQQLHKVSGI